jgi:hypothetical protein
MQTHRVEVIDGPIPDWVLTRSDTEPQLETKPENLSVMHELLQREPLFHRAEFGTSRKDFERMTAPTFWEVGASGRRYSRQTVLDVLDKRYENPTKDVWEVNGFHCLEIAPDNFLATYTLKQGERVSRRATIWRRTPEGWQIVYHQGTLVQ